MSENKLALSFEQLRVGMCVRIVDLETGVEDYAIIDQLIDIHNIYVRFKKGTGLFCLDPNCDREDEIAFFEISTHELNESWLLLQESK